MAEKRKKIPCKVCGKLFEPCAYCQSHADVFRWKNFACSRECAVKYINAATEYRKSLHQELKENPAVVEDKQKACDTSDLEVKTSNKKVRKNNKESEID